MTKSVIKKIVLFDEFLCILDLPWKNYKELKGFMVNVVIWVDFANFFTKIF